MTHLKAEPELSSTAEGLRKPNCHFRGNPGLTVDQIVQSLARNAQHLGARGDGEPQGFEAILPDNAAGVRWVSSAWYYSLVIIHKVNVKSVSILKPEDDSPIRSNGNGPVPFQITFQRMQSVAGKVQLLRPGGGIKDSEQVLDLFDQIGPDPARIPSLKQTPQPRVPKGLDHVPILK